MASAHCRRCRSARTRSGNRHNRHSELHGVESGADAILIAETSDGAAIQSVLPSDGSYPQIHIADVTLLRVPAQVYRALVGIPAAAARVFVNDDVGLPVGVVGKLVEGARDGSTIHAPAEPDPRGLLIETNTSPVVQGQFEVALRSRNVQHRDVESEITGGEVHHFQGARRGVGAELGLVRSILRGGGVNAY